MENSKLLALAKKYGTPLYVYDGDLIIERYKELFDFIPWPKLKIFYAMKANYNLAILRLLEKQGACIDAVSLGDVLLAKRAGFTPERILFTANKITDEEMRAAKAEGILFNIGSRSRLEKFGKEYPGSEVCIRFNPNVVAGEHENVRTGGESTKFGILLSHLDEVLEIAKRYQLKIVGIHEHTGSGIPETVEMMAGMKNILQIVTPKNFPDLKFVDFGGGFKVPYKEGEQHLDYKSFGRDVVALFKKTCDEFGRELEMFFEPENIL